MLNGRHFLHVPGPTNIPERIIRAMTSSMEDQRGANFPKFTKPLYEDMKKIFKTKDGTVIIWPSSGTGSWEASLLNTLSPGDKVLTSRFGQFSFLWFDMCKRLGLDVIDIEVEWGEGVPLEKYAEYLKNDKNKEIKAVLACHNETATGVTSDIEGVRKVLDDAKHPALFFVDGVSSIASINFEFDKWGVDCAVTGSQKGLMLPAGLGILCVSKKALEASKSSKFKKCYFAFEDMLNTNADGWFPYTPALGIMYGLRESLNMISEEGLENVFKRHHRLAEGIRQAVKGWGLKLCAKEKKWESDTVTAIYVPEEFDSANVIKTAYLKYNLALGAGLSNVAGKVFRIGHLGDLNELMCLGAVSGAEMAMRDVGIDIKPGSGIATAEEYYRETAPVLPND